VNLKIFNRWLGLSIFSLLLSLGPPASLQAAAIKDDSGQNLEFKTPPARVISLVPSATEIIAAIGAGDNLAGRTYHDTHFPEMVRKPVIGGPLTPQWDMIAEKKPDLVIIAPHLAEQAKAKLPGVPLWVWNDEAGGLKEAELKIARLGDVFQKPIGKILADDRELMDLIAQKTARIPSKNRLRVMRLSLTENGLSTPGENSFQTEIITAAGGLAPKMGRETWVPVSLEEWKKFNPQAVYACGPGRAELVDYLEQPGWNEAEAVKNKSLHYFPCALTERAAAHTGYFTAWLASTLYSEDFADKSKLVLPEGRLDEKPVPLDMPYVEKAGIIEDRRFDFIHRTLLVNFKTPRLIVSTAGGQRQVKAVGNSFSPTPMWRLNHKGYAESQKSLLRALKLEADSAEILGTGADMNNLAVTTAAFRDIQVTALVTAGVEGNALRTAKDVGNYYEPGTINIIVLVSHALSPQAATRALITVTEAKTAALWDMDVRSVQSALQNPATGTGTDDIIVVSGDKKPQLEWSGGHTKLGQLMSEAVYAGVQEAILKQNGKLPVRDIFERLEERGLSVQTLLGGPDRNFQADFERLLMTPRFCALIEAALSLSDAAGMGQLSEVSLFKNWALEMAGEIAGRPVAEIENIVTGSDLPEILGVALNALGTGLRHRGTEG
jgi:adenosylcobinamide amidohydrolase/ABC-type Fe3+-hydroxamate transport system substrate-binding protein